MCMKTYDLPCRPARKDSNVPLHTKYWLRAYWPNIHTVLEKLSCSWHPPTTNSETTNLEFLKMFYPSNCFTNKIQKTNK